MVVAVLSRAGIALWGYAENMPIVLPIKLRRPEFPVPAILEVLSAAESLLYDAIHSALKCLAERT
jgi:hypothetical protein